MAEATSPVFNGREIILLNNLDMRASIHQDSTLAAIMYAILATAGLFYVNLGGAFLSASGCW